jgi:excinuclease ABC subunit B
MAFNQAHGITPVGVAKRIRDIIDGVYDGKAVKAVADEEKQKAKFEGMSEKQISKQIAQLEKQMLSYAKNLEFEKAAQTRDELAKLKARVFGVSVESMAPNVVAIKAA